MLSPLGLYSTVRTTGMGYTGTLEPSSFIRRTWSKLWRVLDILLERYYEYIYKQGVYDFFNWNRISLIISTEFKRTGVNS